MIGAYTLFTCLDSTFCSIAIQLKSSTSLDFT